MPHAEEITASFPEGSVQDVRLHDGSGVRLRKTDADYDPTDRKAVWTALYEHQASGEIPVGLLFVDEGGLEMHDGARTVDAPLASLPYEDLCPGAGALAKLQQGYR